MNARNRRSARRRAVRKQFPIGAIVKRSLFGNNEPWEVFGYRGQSLLLGRPGYPAQYPAYHWELRRCHTEFVALWPKSMYPTTF